MSSQPTPMMQQWFACKKKAKNALLFFRLGDFYEAFYEDAEIISKEANLTLTKRQSVPMCGVPFHSSDSYIDKLVSKGYKIAIAEQMENPKDTKGIVKRDIVRTVSPATVVNSSLITDKSNNFFVCLSQIGAIFGISAIDLTTSEFQSFEVESLKDLKDELNKLKPAEILISEKMHENNKIFLEELAFDFKFVLNTKEDWYFDHKTCYENLTDHFKVHSLDGFGLNGKIPAINAAGALLSYLKDDLSINLNHLKKITTQSLFSYMAIDYTCMKNLELLGSLSDINKKNTLLNVLDFTKTPMGGRLLKNWIKRPLLNIESIHERQNAVEEFFQKSFVSSEIRQFLSKIRDLERIIMKISGSYAGPKDMLSLRYSLEQLPLFKECLEKNFSSEIIKKEISKIKDLSEVTNLITNAISESAPFRLSDGNIIKEGFNKDLDELKSISKNTKQWMTDYQNELKEKLQIKNLKVGYTRVFGYYIEISKGQANKIDLPQSFQRKQTLVNAERFISSELKDFEHKILTAEDKIQALESSLYDDIKKIISSYVEEINQAASCIAVIDTILSLSTAAEEYDWIKPVVDDSDILQIEKGRHPVIEAALSLNNFIPNDTSLDEKENRLFLITGPNMAGKSTYIRQVAILTIMAQIGSFIPAKSAHIGVVDKVFSRIGASDDLARGQSTFMVEMAEAANILNNATSKSLIILDEIGRGTSTYDGISIAWSIAEYLLTTPEKRAKTLFATHYWELTEMEQKIEGAVNYHIAVKETSNGIVFLRKIEKGSTDKSYGIHVAKLAGIPFEALQIAQKKLSFLEDSKQTKSPKKKSSKTKNSQEEFPLFSYPKPSPIVDELKNLNINSLSPMEALQKLFDMQKQLNT